MFIQRNKKRTLNNIGKKFYNFNFGYEKNIYRYVCYKQVKRKEQQKIEQFKFNSYKEWNNYVLKKYEDYELDELKEFSRYLNLIIRNNKPWQEYLRLITSICLTLFFTETFNEVISVWVEKNNSNIIFSMIIWLISMFIVCFGVFIVMWQTIMPLLNDSIEENMLIDYKEIVDDMIKEKEKICENNTTKI